MNNKTLTVILTLYKRPYMLIKQVEAIKNQTIKPTALWLFQDYTNEANIKIPPEVEDSFDNIKIMNINIGVWGRFDFARQARTDYVCVFDDDTIPGNRWFENCYFQMNKEEGLYGSNGVILIDSKRYPFERFINVGENNPNEITQEVDFVGHSWFLKPVWLDYMFDNTDSLQALKTAGEDMTLSAKLKQHNIKTFVPPHPENELYLWGSIPNSALTDENSLTKNINNLNKYNTGIKLLLKSNFVPIVEQRNNSKNLNLLKFEIIRRLTWLLYRDIPKRIKKRNKLINMFILKNLKYTP